LIQHHAQQWEVTVAKGSVARALGPLHEASDDTGLLHGLQLLMSGRTSAPTLQVKNRDPMAAMIGAAAERALAHYDSKRSGSLHGD
jgi:hypothetical protein